MDCALDAAILITIIIIIIAVCCGVLPTDPSFHVSHDMIQCVSVSLSGRDLKRKLNLVLTGIGCFSELRCAESFGLDRSPCKEGSISHINSCSFTREILYWV